MTTQKMNCKQWFGECVNDGTEYRVVQAQVVVAAVAANVIIIILIIIM
jgi:hypothetical protein